MHLGESRPGCYLHISPGGQGPLVEVLRRLVPVELQGAGGGGVRGRRSYGFHRLLEAPPQLPLCCVTQLVLIIALVHPVRPRRHQKKSNDENLWRGRQTAEVMEEAEGSWSQQRSCPVCGSLT